MISLSTQTSSTYHLVIKHFTSTDYKTLTRRVSRIATLDGDSTITDSGFTNTDRTLTIKAKITKAEWVILEYMTENYSLWNVSVEGEFFSCAPKSCKAPGGDLTLTLLVAE